MTNAAYELNELEQFIQREILQSGKLTEFLEKGTFNQFMSGSDIWALFRFLGGRESHDPIGTFWTLYEAGSGFHCRDLLPERSEEWDEIVLASLSKLYLRYKVPYEPDGESPVEYDFQSSPGTEQLIIPDKLRDLITFLHVAAARAFTIKRRQGRGLDEVALDCLGEAVRALGRLYANGLGDLIDCQPSQLLQLSSEAVAAKAYLELGRVYHREGNFADAFHHFATAALHASYAAERYISEGGDSDWSSSLEQVPMKPSCELTSRIVEAGLDNISAGEIASVFLSLKASGHVANWSRVAQDCNVLLFESDYMVGAFPDTYMRTVGDDYE